MHGDSPYDNAEIAEAMGFCPECHDHMPCGCDNGYEICDICGETNTPEELDANDYKCFNCSTSFIVNPSFPNFNPSKRFEDLANKLSGKKPSPDWMVDAILQSDMPERIMR